MDLMEPGVHTDFQVWHVTVLNVPKLEDHIT